MNTVKCDFVIKEILTYNSEHFVSNMSPLRRLHKPIIDTINQRIESGDNFISIELCANTTSDLIFTDAAFDVSTFYSIVWNGQLGEFKMGSKESTPAYPQALLLAKTLKNHGANVLMHLTSCGLTTSRLHMILNYLLDINVRDLLVLRGDGSKFLQEFSFALSLMNAIRASEFLQGDYFSMAVAGYPEGHPESPDKEADMKILLHKIRAGAKFIVTQIFFDVAHLINFINVCHRKDVHTVVLPEIYCISSYSSLLRMAQLTKVSIPNHILNNEHLKRNTVAFREFAINFSVEQVKTIFNFSFDECKVCSFKRRVYGVHFFTMNNFNLLRDILKRLGFGKYYMEYPLILRQRRIEDNANKVKTCF